jgi:hypothetical protein
MYYIYTYLNHIYNFINKKIKNKKLRKMGCANDNSIEVDNRIVRRFNREYSSEDEDIQDFEEYESK